jgi:hypothetical protein
MKENGSPYKPSVRFWYLIYWAVARITKKPGKLQTKIARAGEISAWSRYLGREFGHENLALYRDKDSLRQSLFDLVSTNDKVIVLELGVAFGKGSKWIIDRLSTKLLEFHGFDRFTGLPRAWRGLSIGHFSTNGIPPEINDPRVVWHVGNAEKTLKDFLQERQSSFQTARSDFKFVVIFDLDILEPTLECYQLLKPLLLSGDLIHFDEAFDAENERVVMEIFLKDFEVEFVGYTSEAASFKILRTKSPTI